MKVYVLSKEDCGICYECGGGFFAIKVFDSKGKAEKYAKDMNWKDWEWSIEEFEIE